MKQKHVPHVGEKLYTYTPCSSYWVSMVHDPYTVVSVNKNATVCVIREAGLIFHGPRYYNTIADEIYDDPHGKEMVLRWSEKKQRWQESPAGSYPRVAVFGMWDHQPYLD